jgi:arylsulfatase
MGGFELTARVVVPDDGLTEGVLAAIGDRHGGWAAYLLGGRLVATVALLDATTRVAAPDPVAPGEHELSVRYEPGPDARLVLAVDGADVAESPLTGLVFFPNLGSAGIGLLVGRDRGLAVSPDYRPPFAFTGTLREVELRSGRPHARPDRSAELRVALAGD